VAEPSASPKAGALPSLPAWPAKIASRISGGQPIDERAIAAEAVVGQQHGAAGESLFAAVACVFPVAVPGDEEGRAAFAIQRADLPAWCAP